MLHIYIYIYDISRLRVNLASQIMTQAPDVTSPQLEVEDSGLLSSYDV